MYEFGRRPPASGSSRARGLIEMEDPEGTFFAWLRASGGAQRQRRIVRPDRFVFALVPAREVVP